MTREPQDPRQFSSFDGLDNRKAVMDLFVRLGENTDEMTGARRRQAFLRSLFPKSPEYGHLPFHVTPCDAVGAYHLFVAITGVLRVPIEKAAALLEAEVRRVTNA